MLAAVFFGITGSGGDVKYHAGQHRVLQVVLVEEREVAASVPPLEIFNHSALRGDLDDASVGYCCALGPLTRKIPTCHHARSSSSNARVIGLTPAKW